MYKIPDILHEKLIEVISANFSIKNFQQHDQKGCGYCFATDSSFSGQIKHEDDCDGKQLIYALENLVDYEDDGGKAHSRYYLRY